MYDPNMVVVTIYLRNRGTGVDKSNITHDHLLIIMNYLILIKTINNNNRADCHKVKSKRYILSQVLSDNDIQKIYNKSVIVYLDT